MCSHAAAAAAAAAATATSPIFIADFPARQSNPCKGNEVKLCPFPSGNVTRRGSLQHSHHHSQRRAVSSHITIEVHHSRIVLASDVPVQVNRAQTFWPRIRLEAYVVCICYCAHTHTLTHTQKYSISYFPLLPATRPRDPAWTEYHTKACHVCCVCAWMCVFLCVCVCVCVWAQMSEGPGGAFCSEPACVCVCVCVSLSAVLHRRSETNKSPSTHPHTHTHTHTHTHRLHTPHRHTYTRCTRKHTRHMHTGPEPRPTMRPPRGRHGASCK